MVVHWVDETVFVIVAREFIGSLSNYDDLKKKKIGLMIKTTALHVHHAF